MGSSGPRAGPAPLLLLLVLLGAERPGATELTFELPDSAEQCFHEAVESGVKFSLDFQVSPAAGRAGGDGRVPSLSAPGGPTGPRVHGRAYVPRGVGSVQGRWAHGSPALARWVQPGENGRGPERWRRAVCGAVLWLVPCGSGEPRPRAPTSSDRSRREQVSAEGVCP